MIGCPVSSFEVYDVQRLKNQYIDKSAQVCISAIQRMYSIRKDEPLGDALEEANPAKQLTKPKAPLILKKAFSGQLVLQDSRTKTAANAELATVS